VPQVASETSAHPISLTYRPARPDPAPGHAPASAFETMLDESAPAAERPRASSASNSASPERPESRPPVESRSPATSKTGSAGSGDDEPAEAKAADNKSADAGSTGSKTGDTDQGEATDPATPTEVTTEFDAAAQVDAQAEVDASGETETDGDETKAGDEPVKTAGQPANPDPDIIDDGVRAEGSGTDTGNADATALSGPKTGPAVAPTPTAAAHSENATHAADAAEGRTPPAAAAALQAAASKPADARAKGEEKQAAGPELPPQAKAEDAPGRGEQKPALPEHVDLPAQSHRNALPDNAAMAGSSNAHAAAKAAADATQPLAMAASLQQQQPAQSSAATATVSPQIPAQAAAVPLSGVAIEIASRALNGRNRFEIRLDPPELGRIEVRLDVDRDGRVTSHLIADRKDTLSLLQRDSAGLQRALQDAGLKTADEGLQFSLRDQSHGQNQERAGRSDAAQLVVEDDSLPTPVTIAGGRFFGRDGGVDIRV